MNNIKISETLTSKTKWRKWRKWCLSPVAAITALLLAHSPAQAQSLFSRAENAMNCIIKDASTNSATNTIIKNLPNTVFIIITFVIFAYALVQAIQIFQAVRNGEEATQYIMPVMSFSAGLVLILVLQAVLFTDKTC